DRYFSTHYRTSQSEIESWLKKYKHLPIADEIYRLGEKKKFKLKSKKPKSILHGGQTHACTSVRRDEPIDLLKRRIFSELKDLQKKEALQLFRQLIKYIEDGRTLPARKLIESKQFQRTIPQQDIALAQTALSFSYFLDREYNMAFKQVKNAIQNAKTPIPLAYWTAGLTQWQREEYESAEKYFSKITTLDNANSLLRASAGFWSARANLKIGEYTKIGDYLEIASQEPQTFYGMLAVRMMGLDLTHHNDNLPQTTVTQLNNPALKRFYALNQIGNKQLAGKELAQLYLKSNDMEKAILKNIAKQNDFDTQLNRLIKLYSDNTEYFPLPNWKPTGGWKSDKALVYAFVRQESCFDYNATSKVGAKGLMQLMPYTAKAMAKQAGLKWNAYNMYAISYNLALGQQYIRYLLNLPAVSNNLIYLAVAYNGGPGNLIKWKKKTNYPTDALVFIESIPSRETRAFVERILVNYWVYRALMNRSLTSMDLVISEQWPMYEPYNLEQGKTRKLH
ncbi:MAG: lytic transglycosylase domain-containing protein, partial [Alphaproteobacteria bacterium]|nr:lytic transglycosylase domain-containing protein [Alphaproteobacteria bacterium]